MGWGKGVALLFDEWNKPLMSRKLKKLIMSTTKEIIVSLVYSLVFKTFPIDEWNKPLMSRKFKKLIMSTTKEIIVSLVYSLVFKLFPYSVH